jgi:hypothetical protein
MDGRDSSFRKMDQRRSIEKTSARREKPQNSRNFSHFNELLDILLGWLL